MSQHDKTPPRRPLHERTKKQAAHDRKRDRTLTGWTVLRFTGSEIHRDGLACVAELLQALAR